MVCGPRAGAGLKEYGCWAGPRPGAGLSLPRKLEEQDDRQAGQQVKQHEFVHLLSQAGLPALREEEQVRKTSGPWTPKRLGLQTARV